MLVDVYGDSSLEREERGGNLLLSWGQILSEILQNTTAFYFAALAAFNQLSMFLGWHRSMQSSFSLWKDFTHYLNSTGGRSVLWRMFSTNSSSFKRTCCQCRYLTNTWIVPVKLKQKPLFKTKVYNHHVHSWFIVLLDELHHWTSFSINTSEVFCHRPQSQPLPSLLPVNKLECWGF